MGFRGSRIQIPPSRLSEDQALQRLSLWGCFFACTPCCEFCCESGSAAHNPLRRMQHHSLHRFGIGLLIRTKQRLLVLPAPGFHHIAYRVALPFGSPFPADRVPHHPAFGRKLRDLVRLPFVGSFGALKTGVLPIAPCARLTAANASFTGSAIGTICSNPVLAVSARQRMGPSGN